MKVVILALALLVVSAVMRALGDDFVPFVIPQEMSKDSQIVLPPSPPFAPDSPRVEARDGHFFREGRRVRIWGVNLCFGANFPRKQDAEKVAARLAGFGVNSVRFHHMDSSAFPRGIWDPKDPMKLSGEALDRLDYFIDQLARRGICVNLNLHVSRTQSKHLELPDPGTGYDKIADIFTPELIDAQKRYARDLLTHVNPYRKARYAEDPAIAFVEINNEDSLFMWGAERKLPALPEYYAMILAGKWQAWLKGRYGTTAALKAAWDKGAEPLGDDLLAGKLPPAKWNLEQHAGCKAKVLPVQGMTRAARVEIAQADGTDWHVQLNLGGLVMKKGRYHTMSFRARAERDRGIGVNVGQAHAPWGMLGLATGVKLNPKWQEFRLGFTCSGDDDNARVNFQMGGAAAAVEITDVELRPGGQTGLLAGETIEAGTVALFAGNECPERSIDRMIFLAETEKAYFDDMRRFVKEELGCKAMVTGTIVFGPLGLWAQSGMDYIDAHAYWQHPRFPGRPWDPENWIVEQKAMVDHPDQSPLLNLAASRLAGKPFTVSEYNHSAPNDYQAECVPMIASFAAAQDWDGVWLFAYSHRTDDWDRGHFTSFFDIDANPAKWGFMPAGTMIFREGALPPLKSARIVPLAERGSPAELAPLQMTHGLAMFAAAGQTGKLGTQVAIRERLYVAMNAEPIRLADVSPARPTNVLWSVTRQGHGSFSANGGGALIFAGWAESGGPPWFGVYAMVALDGRDAPASRRMLVTACRGCENTDMKYSADRRTVGRNWGKPPTCVEPVSVSLAIPADRWRCTALLSNGSTGPQVRVEGDYLGMSLPLAPAHKTMWYLLVRSEEATTTRPEAETP